MKVVETINFKKAYTDLNTMPHLVDEPSGVSKDIVPLMVNDRCKRRRGRKRRPECMKDRLPADGGIRLNDEPNTDEIPKTML